MGDVLDFPSNQAQGLAFLERRLRDMLVARGADEPLIEFATAELNRIYSRIRESEDYSFSVALPEGLSDRQRSELESSINAGLEEIRRENHGLTLELVAQLLLTQVRLFEHERGSH